jgi:hypothetical protein
LALSDAAFADLTAVHSSSTVPTDSPETPPHDPTNDFRDKAFLARSFLRAKLRSKNAKVEAEVVEIERNRAE